MTLERGRRAASEHRAIDNWRREAVEGRATIAMCRVRIAELLELLEDAIAERDALVLELDRILGSYDAWLEASDARAAKLLDRLFRAATDAAEAKMDGADK